MALNKECKKYLSDQVKVAVTKWPDWTTRDVKDFILTGHQRYDLSLLNQKTLEKYIGTSLTRIKRTHGDLKAVGLNPTNSPNVSASQLVGHQEVEQVEKNGQVEKPVICSPKYLVPEDLKQMIIDENPTRSITFTMSQRNNTQMVLDEFVFKKKKGPDPTQFGRSIYWQCVSDSCRFVVVSFEGRLEGRPGKAESHNHPPQPDLYIKKIVREKLRKNIASDRTKWESNHVSGLIQNIVQETEAGKVSQLLNKQNDALKQFANRFNRKIKTKTLKETQEEGDGSQGNDISNLLASKDIKAEGCDESLISYEDIKEEEYDESYEISRVECTPDVSIHQTE